MKKLKYSPDYTEKLRALKNIVNIYNEREDFMMDLFGISTTSSESEEYWEE